MPKAMHSFYLRNMYQNNKLIQPGGITLKGVPIDLTTVTLASQLRTATDDLVATLPITVTNQAGVATIQVADTTLWPIGLLHGDIKMVTGGLPVLSETFAVRVNRQSTL